MPTRTRTVLAWSLWLATFGCCAAGLAVTLAVVRPLTVAVLAEGAARALVYPLGYATVGLVLTLRRPGNPIGWLYAAAGLMWSLAIPGEPWVAQLVAEGRPLPLAAQAAAVYGEFNWAAATILGVTLPALLVPDGRLRSRRWRPVAAAAVAAGALALVGSSLAPARLEDPRSPTRSGWPGPPAPSPPRWPAPARSSGWPPWSRRCSAWCCGSGPPVGWSASSCAGSPPAPPPRWPG